MGPVEVQGGWFWGKPSNFEIVFHLSPVRIIEFTNRQIIKTGIRKRPSIFLLRTSKFQDWTYPLTLKVSENKHDAKWSEIKSWTLK